MRWLHCTAAPRLEANIPDNGSDFAREGTLAHAMCARHLKKYLGQNTENEDAEIRELYDEYHSGEMDEYTEMYKNNVLSRFFVAKRTTPDAQLLVETRLDFSQFIPESFGTADAIIIADGLMEVIDFKYGKGIKVNAHENPQMMIYALGALQKFSFEYNITHIRMTIIQPRIDNLSEYELTADALFNWASMVLAPKAKEAYSDDGKQIPGAWCQFCKVKGCCKALAKQAIDISDKFIDPALLSKKDMENTILPKLEVVKMWLKGIEEYTLEKAVSGVDYKGFKLVEGRSMRKIADTAAVMDALAKLGYDERLYLKPTELKGITDLEKLVGKKKFTLSCGDYITKPQGKPALVPDTDPREAFNSAQNDFKDIK